MLETIVNAQVTTPPLFACSPDGLIGSDGGLEIKRLDDENHVKTRLGDIDKKYLAQIEWCLFVTDRKWWDYMGYCETIPEPLTADIRRIEATDKRMNEIKKIALDFIGELEINLEQFRLAA